MSDDRLTYKYLLLVAVFGFIARAAPGLRYLPELTEAVIAYQPPEDECHERLPQLPAPAFITGTLQPRT